nr:protein MAIN-LIKE 2-like [Setaria viridis]
MREDADEATVARHLEAYLLWLFGWTLFCTSQGNSVPKHLVPYARAIAEAPLAEVPQYSWGSAVLATTYGGLCTSCVKVSSAEPIFLGCPLLLQLWAYERFPIGRPRVDMSPYPGGFDEDDDDKHTMGSFWCLRRAVWTGVQTKKSYPNFIGMFDALVDTDVRWRPYSFEEVEARAPHGLSSLYYRDMAYWRTRRLVIYDIHVEDYVVHRVMRQFRLYQYSPLSETASRQGGGGGGPGVLWAPSMVHWVALRATALDEVVQEARAHDAYAFTAHLRWFLSMTSTRVLFVPTEPPTETAPVTQTYPRVRDVNYDCALTYDIEHFDVLNALQHRSLLTGAKDVCKRFISAVSCRGGHGDVFLPPQAPYPRASSPAPTQQAGL